MRHTRKGIGGSNPPLSASRTGCLAVSLGLKAGWVWAHCAHLETSCRWTDSTTVMQEALFVGFSIERHVPADHLLHFSPCMLSITVEGPAGVPAW